MRRIYVSNLPMAITPMAKGLNLRSEQNKNHQVKDVDRVVQRPRAVLSSPGMTITLEYPNTTKNLLPFAVKVCSQIGKI